MATKTAKQAKRVTAKKAASKKEHSFTKAIGIANTGDMKAYEYKTAINLSN